MRVLLVTPTFFPVVGGVEVGIDKIASELASSHEVQILTPLFRRDPEARCNTSAGESKKYGVRYFVNPLGSAPRVFRRIGSLFGLGFYRALTSAVAEFRPDVINLHLAMPYGVPFLLWRWRHRQSLPLVVSLVSSSDVYGQLSLMRRAYMRFVIRGAVFAVPNSEYYLRSAPRGMRLKQRIIPFGAPVKAEVAKSGTAAAGRVHDLLGIARDAFILLTVQRLYAEKWTDFVLRAFREVVDDGVKAVHLVVVGDGPEMGRLRMLAQVLGIAERTHFVGEVPNSQVGNYFEAATVFALGSPRETFGVVLVEAMAAGVPIVAQRASSIPDIVVDGKNGLLAEPGDTLAMARNIRRLLMDYTLSSRISKENRRRAQLEFSWDLIGLRYESMLLEAISVSRRFE